MKMCVTEPDFLEKSTSSKNEQKWPKNGVLDFLGKSIQMLLANQISVFFNRQYLGNGLTSDSNFLLLDIHE